MTGTNRTSPPRSTVVSVLGMSAIGLRPIGNGCEKVAGVGYESMVMNI